MTFSTKALLAATAVSLGLAATPVSAQVGDYDRGYAGRADGFYGREGVGYDDTGRANVFGARIDPRGTQGGLIGGVGNVVGGVGTAVGGVVDGTVGAADDVVTGSIGGRRTDYSARRGNAEQLDRPVAQYGRTSGGPAAAY